MPRNALPTASFLALLAVVIFAPVIASGYAELRQATAAKTYLEAAIHYQAAAQRLPWRADLYELAGHAYYNAREYSRAESAYQKAFKRNALDPDGWVAWGDVLYLNHHEEEAVEIWERGLDRQNFSEKLYSRLSQAYKEEGKYFEAAQVLQRYVAAHPDASAHYRLGLLLTLTNPDQGLSELITASQLDPQFDPAVQALRSALNQASLSDTSSGRFVLTGRGLGLVQEWELARVAFDSAVQADVENAEAWAWLGEASYHTGLDGSEELDQALELDPSSAIVRGLRGLYFQRTGNHRSALAEFQAAAQLDDQNPAWQVSIGETYSKLGDMIRAVEAYQAATRLAPRDAAYYPLLALFCAQNNVNVSSVGVPAAQKAVALEKDSVESLDLLGWLLLLVERYEYSEQILKQALELEPKNATVHFHLGMLYLQLDDRTAAREHLATARDLGSTDAEAILNQYFP